MFKKFLVEVVRKYYQEYYSSMMKNYHSSRWTNNNALNEGIAWRAWSNMSAFYNLLYGRPTYERIPSLRK
jgi:hypothetical protein